MATVKTSISLSPKMAQDLDEHWQEHGYVDRNNFITTAILLQMERDKLKKANRTQTQHSVPYRLGCVLAVLEANSPDGQEDYSRHLAKACLSPLEVYTRLLRQNTDTLPGDAQTRIGELLNDIDSFPAQLTVPEQGDLQLGYYHERAKLATK